MLYHKCEVCGENFNKLMIEASENEHDAVCKCPKCETQYKVQKINKKKLYMLAIPLAIVCVLGYILLRWYFDIDAFYGKIAIVGVISIFFAIIFINHVKNLKFEKIDENDTGNTNEQSSQHSK
ncbi:hypothetical protein CQA53_09905 [Helicobacter didelphidarum]|uniref:Cxxc_20_cxxc protein n=1 Tax=Helicobacter didelphidarum TaxID=2040648 RepID=A0A3D8I8V8_9HELI|nr:hypothetical protein [Helicobacter didelphidarum]RDU61593.1 hypothetical protein CQA53_09905 [Helicobacter didelphidarum]